MASVYRKAPKIVSTLCQICDAWVIGGSVDYLISDDKHQEKPNDIDIVIPLVNWNEASKILPKECKINSCGGFKFWAPYPESGEVEIDVWCDDVARIIAYYQKRTKAYHPKTGALLTKEII